MLLQYQVKMLLAGDGRYDSPGQFLLFISDLKCINVKANMPRVKVVIWDFFTVSEDSNKFASCSICKDLVSRGGSCVKSFNTTNLIDHLKKKHPGDYVDYEEKKKIRELKEMEKKKETDGFPAAHNVRSGNQGESMALMTRMRCASIN